MAVPVQLLVGVNDTMPVVVSTEYVPPVTVTEVAVQLGLTCPLPHRRTDVASSVINGSVVVSLANTFFVCVTFTWLEEVSATAVGAGGAVTDGVIVAFTYWPRPSTA